MHRSATRRACARFALVAIAGCAAAALWASGAPEQGPLVEAQTCGEAMDAEGLSTLLLLSSGAQPLNPFTAAKPVRL
jgi:hypothetical protein